MAMEEFGTEGKWTSRGFVSFMRSQGDRSFCVRPATFYLIKYVLKEHGSVKVHSLSVGSPLCGTNHSCIRWTDISMRQTHIPIASSFIIQST